LTGTSVGSPPPAGCEAASWAKALPGETDSSAAATVERNAVVGHVMVDFLLAS
jgi:hypothetical protein